MWPVCSTERQLYVHTLVYELNKVNIVDPWVTRLKQIAIATIVTKNELGTGSRLPKLKIWRNVF